MIIVRSVSDSDEPMSGPIWNKLTSGCQLIDLAARVRHSDIRGVVHTLSPFLKRYLMVRRILLNSEVLEPCPRTFCFIFNLTQ